MNKWKKNQTNCLIICLADVKTVNLCAKKQKTMRILSFMLLLLLGLTAQAGRIKTDTIESKVLGEKVVYNIYLPSGF